MADIFGPLGQTGNIAGSRYAERQEAAATLIDPAILVLNEVTSSVNIRMEVKIQKAMTRLKLGMTSIAIAYRLSTIQNSDLLCGTGISRSGAVTRSCCV